MWKPRRLTILWASTACYRDSFTFFRRVNSKFYQNSRFYGNIHIPVARKDANHTTFLYSLPRPCKGICKLGKGGDSCPLFVGWGGVSLLYHARMKMTMKNVEQLVVWASAGETRSTQRKPDPCHVVHHKSHITWPEFDPGPPRRAARAAAWPKDSGNSDTEPGAVL
jgi:hypothetical protein